MQLSPRFHGYLDYFTVAVFALAPTLLGLGGEAAALCYGFAVVHLLLSLATDYPAGVTHLIPFTLHGKIELVAGVSLLALPLILGFAVVPTVFFVVMGVTVLAIWSTTPYAKVPHHAT